MEADHSSKPGKAIESNDPNVSFLVKSALQKVASEKLGSRPRGRQEWVERLVEAVVASSDTQHHSVISELVATGVTSDEIFHSIVPEASRLLGELWVSDKVTFVDVTVGAGRLQRLVREGSPDHSPGWLSRTTPLGQPILMIIPEFEDHSLGAFVAADGLRRHGLWVHMSIGLSAKEIVETVSSHRFAMVGISISMRKHVAETAKLVDLMRSIDAYLPPIVIGGRAVDIVPQAAERVGADHAVKTAREAIEKCSLSTLAPPLGIDNVD